MTLRKPKSRHHVKTAANMRALSRITAIMLALPTAVAADVVAPLIPICFEGALDFQTRADGIKALGYTPLDDMPDLWLEGQLLHIAMGELEFSGADAAQSIQGSYATFLEMAESGTLFRDDIDSAFFQNATGDMAINLSIVDGEPGCTIAFGKDRPAPDLTEFVTEKWTHESGAFMTFRLGSGLSAMSTFTRTWDDWIAGERQAGSFLGIIE